MLKLRKVWKDRGISISTKVRLIRALVFSVVTYGCESWTLKKKARAKISSFEYWCWRRLLGISWKDRRTNESITKELGVEPQLVFQIDKQKLSFVGHVCRANGLEKTIMLGMGEGKRKRGKPRMRWIDGVRELMDLTSKC